MQDQPVLFLLMHTQSCMQEMFREAGKNKKASVYDLSSFAHAQRKQGRQNKALI